MFIQVWIVVIYIRSGKTKQICPLWPKRIAPSDPNNIDHLVRILPEIFLCRFESPSLGVTGVLIKSIQMNKRIKKF